VPAASVRPRRRYSAPILTDDEVFKAKEFFDDETQVAFDPEYSVPHKVLLDAMQAYGVKTSEKRLKHLMERLEGDYNLNVLYHKAESRKWHDGLRHCVWYDGVDLKTQH
jgi:hypothetical protein